jgi:hypothetical protein
MCRYGARASLRGRRVAASWWGKVGPEQDDLLRPRLVDIIDMRHEMVKLSELIDWGFDGVDTPAQRHRFYSDVIGPIPARRSFSCNIPESLGSKYLADDRRARSCPTLCGTLNEGSGWRLVHPEHAAMTNSGATQRHFVVKW